MAIWTFNSAHAGKPMIMDALDGIDVAARYFVYKLYEGTDGQPMQWATLYGLGESAASISRAVERGWVVLQGTKPPERKAALTYEGRRLARTLLLLANVGKDGGPQPITTPISQETLAEIIGTTRPRVSLFMNKFRKLGFINYNGHLEVHSSLLSVMLRESKRKP